MSPRRTRRIEYENIAKETGLPELQVRRRNDGDRDAEARSGLHAASPGGAQSRRYGVESEEAWADIDKVAYEQSIKKWRETKDITAPFGRGIQL